MQYPRSDSNYQGENDNCEALAPFVMSLFDGQADEYEAKRARAHLLVCQTCAHRWLDWNRSRDLLRSVPVPAPPPTQLWRVLMACRLAAFSQQRSKRKTSSDTNFNGAPANLSAQILARTTRAAAPLPATSTATKWRGLGMPALAVPVMAMWLLVLQRDTFIATVPLDRPLTASETTIESSIEESSIEASVENTAPRRAPRRLPLRSVVLPRVGTAPAKVVAQPRMLRIRPVEVAAPRIVREAPVREVVWAGRDVSRVEVGRVDVGRVEDNFRATARFEATQVEARLRETAPRVVAPQAVPVRSPRVVPVALPAAFKQDRPVVQTLAVPAPTFRTMARPASPAPQFVSVALTAPVRPRVARVALRAASLSDDENTLRLRTSRSRPVAPAASQTAIVRVSAPAQIMRVSLPSSSAPSPAPARLLAENFESYDGRVEEMRSVVDDFRASLAPDNVTASDADEDLSRS